MLVVESMTSALLLVSRRSWIRFQPETTFEVLHHRLSYSTKHIVPIQINVAEGHELIPKLYTPTQIGSYNIGCGCGTRWYVGFESATREYGQSQRLSLL